MSIILKVQRTDGSLTENACIASGMDAAQRGEAVTFYAYSDMMKARILEKIAAGFPYQVTICPNGTVPRDGEWLEPLANCRVVRLASPSTETKDGE